MGLAWFRGGVAGRGSARAGGPGGRSTGLAYAAAVRIGPKVAISAAAFGVAVGVAEAAGAANLGTALGIAQVCFAVALVALLLLR